MTDNLTLNRTGRTMPATTPPAGGRIPDTGRPQGRARHAEGIYPYPASPTDLSRKKHSTYTVDPVTGMICPIASDYDVSAEQAAATDTVQRYQRSAPAPVAKSPALLMRIPVDALIPAGSGSRSAQIARLMSRETLADLFDYVVAGIEQRLGREIVAPVLALLCASRQGLSVAELMELTGASQGAVMQVLNALRNHLARRDDRYEFLHEHLSGAVTRRYIGEDEGWRELHLQLAAYFAGKPIGERRLDEEPWHLVCAREWEMLKCWLTTIPLLLFVDAAGRGDELASYWRFLEERYDMVAEYRKAVHQYMLTHAASREELAHIYDILSDLYRAFTPAETAGAWWMQLSAQMPGGPSLRDTEADAFQDFYRTTEAMQFSLS